MAITLAEAKVGMADHVNQTVIDTFRRSSALLDNLTFDNAISPGTGGSTLTYGYIQLKTPSTAAVRTINDEYTAGEAKREEKTAKAIIMGGSFKIDRVIAETSGAVDELAFQVEQKVKATANYFHNCVINGCAAASGAGYVVKTFDGLKKLLTGTANEFTSTVDISDAAKVDANYNAFLDEVDALIAAIDGNPTALLMNTAMLTKFRSIARRSDNYENTVNELGRKIEKYCGIELWDMGKYYNGTATEDVIATGTDGKTDIYAVCLGLDGLHGISPTGNSVIASHLPDLALPGAVKEGDVELVAGIVLKSTLKAAVLKGVQIKGATA